MIPDWLTEEEAVAAGSDADSLRTQTGCNLRGRYVEKGIKGVVRLTRICLLNEEMAARPGWLQQKNSDFKLLAVLLWIISLSLSKNLIFMGALYILILILAHKSLIGMGYFLTRVWLFIPLFTGAIVFPAIFNFIIPGPSLFVIIDLGRPYSFGPWEIPREISITTAGLEVAAILVCRVAVSVSAALLFSLTTKWHDIFRAFGILRVPQVFILIFSMSFRYIQLLLRSYEEMHLAKKSRTIEVKSYKNEHRWVGFSMAALFNKSLKMSDDVHLAMISRGFDGRIKTLGKGKWQKTDYLWLAFSLALLSLAIKIG